MDALPQSEHRRLRGARSPREGSAVTEGMFMRQSIRAFGPAPDELPKRASLREAPWTLRRASP
jgi:hypothetical protein